MTWMGSWAFHLRQGTPRPQQGIFSCRLHSCLGLSVSHTLREKHLPFRVLACPWGRDTPADRHLRSPCGVAGH